MKSLDGISIDYLALLIWPDSSSYVLILFVPKFSIQQIGHDNQS